MSLHREPAKRMLLTAAALVFPLLICTPQARAESQWGSGKNLYEKVCGHCHKPEVGVGTLLAGRELPAEYVRVIVRNGFNGMPAFPASFIDDESITQVAEYLSKLPAPTPAMDMNRRLVLKGLGLGGIASFAMASSPRASSAPIASAGVGSRLVLVNDDIAGHAFLQGAAISGSNLRALTLGPDLRDILEVQRQLRSPRPMRIIGLLDDATGTLVLDAARSAGARVNWLCQHTARGDHIRHHVMHATRALQRALQDPSEWASTIGYLLALDTPDRAAPAPYRIAEMHGNFISLSIELGETNRG
jgi:mono/diheme cytochrome c family protein